MLWLSQNRQFLLDLVYQLADSGALNLYVKYAFDDNTESPEWFGKGSSRLKFVQQLAIV